MKQENKDILIDTREMKHGLNQAQIHQVGGPINSYGVIQQGRSIQPYKKGFKKLGCDIVILKYIYQGLWAVSAPMMPVWPANTNLL